MTESDFNRISAELSAVNGGDAFFGRTDPAGLPKMKQAVLLTDETVAALLPLTQADRPGEYSTSDAIKHLHSDFQTTLSPVTNRAEQIADGLISLLPRIKRDILSDALAIYEGDPAATSPTEVMLCYPGFFAITVYRIAHAVFSLGAPCLARMMSEYAHRETGIDIHPGAEIGESFCIDHGTGVVIGETARIGRAVKIYQGVTLGAKSFERDESGGLIKGKKRHPTVGDGCVIYAGATILGGDTVIGDGCVIGGNVWLTHSLPAGTRVYYDKK